MIESTLLIGGAFVVFRLYRFLVQLVAQQDTIFYLTKCSYLCSVKRKAVVFD